MAFTIEFTAAAAKEFRALPPDIRRRVTLRIDQLALDPRPVGCVKIAGEPNTFRIRIGDYRVLYDIEANRLLVLVLRVRHRRDAYR